MRRVAVMVAACWCLSTLEASAQTRASSLATLFEDIYGPNGLVLSSDDVALDGTTHDDDDDEYDVIERGMTHGGARRCTTRPYARSISSATSGDARES